jgi:CubicO group peptidase (beta-lactamase class C family)
MRKHGASIGLALVLLFVPAGRTTAETAAKALSQAPPAAVGLSPERLDRLSATMRQAVDEGRAAGIVTLVARRGRIVHFAAFGKQDVESGVPMARDTIFRIASQSKAVTSVAAMVLVEEGKLLLSDPVSKYVPAFKKTVVRVPPPEGVKDAAGGTVPAKREITIRDLLTHTSGVSYGSGPLEAQYKAANVLGWYFADKDEPIGAVIERLAALPFEAQPGEKYIYGFSTDILGYVVEKASGQSLDEVFRTRILGPLRMTDTHFFLPKEKASRLAAVYSLAEGGKIQRAPDAGMGQGDYVNGPRRCFSGGAGLLSTATDYARLLEMLRNGGELDGVRVLGRKSVELMTTNHVGTLYQEGRFGFGLAFEITEHVGRAGRYGSVGEFGWGGAYHTNYWVDPAEGLVAVFMTQLLPADGSDLQAKFRSLLYQAIVDPVAR